MTIESEVAALTTATTGLMTAVNVQKSALDTAVSSATSSASAASGSYASTVAINGIATAAAGTATTQASAATAAAVGASNIVLGVSTLLPTIRPSLNLDFANSKTLDPRITFSRPSPASYTCPDGIMRYAAANVPVIDYDPITGGCRGLAAWEQRTNLLTYSENFENEAWGNAGISTAPNVSVAPDGTLTATKLTEASGGALHYLSRGTVGLSNSTITKSIYARPDSRTLLKLQFSDNVSYVAACVFDLSTKTVTSTSIDNAGYTGVRGEIADAGHGWLRCSITSSRSGINPGNSTSLFLVDSGVNVTYAGDGVSGLYVWGAQLEAGSFPTPYIPSSLSFASRVGSATYINSAGLIASAATNVARMNYNPLNLTLAPKLLLEGASTNLLTYSEDFGSVVWAKVRSSITANAATAPDGTVTADKLVEDATAGNSHLLYPSAGSIVSGTAYSISVYAKESERSVLQLVPDGGIFPSTYANFDLSALTVSAIGASATATIISLANGWVHCSITATATSSATIVPFYVYLCNSPTISRGAVYTGNGTSGLYIWGAQLEPSPFPTSYIPTTTAQVTRNADVHTSAAATRAADVANMTGANFSSWYRQDEGSFVTTFDAPNIPVNSTTYNRVVTVNSGVGTDGMSIIIYGGYAPDRVCNQATKSLAIGFNSGETSGGYISTPVSLAKNAMVYKAKDFAVSWNGASVYAATGDVIQASQLSIGSYNGHIASFRYYPKRLTNTELQALSAN